MSSEASPSRLAAAAQFGASRDKLVRRLELEAAGAASADDDAAAVVECDRYRVDIAAATFGACKCGAAKAAHSSAALEAARAPTPTSEQVAVAPAPVSLPAERVSCARYVVDTEGSSFGVCICGAERGAHTEAAVDAGRAPTPLEERVERAERAAGPEVDAAAAAAEEVEAANALRATMEEVEEIEWLRNKEIDDRAREVDAASAAAAELEAVEEARALACRKATLSPTNESAKKELSLIRNVTTRAANERLADEGGGAGESAGPGEILANFGRGWRGADRSEDGPEGTHRPKR